MTNFSSCGTLVCSKLTPSVAPGRLNDGGPAHAANASTPTLAVAVTRCDAARAHSAAIAASTAPMPSTPSHGASTANGESTCAYPEASQGKPVNSHVRASSANSHAALK